MLELKKPPSVSETIDWARTLLILGADVIEREALEDNLNLLLKHQRDIELAAAELDGLIA